MPRGGYERRSQQLRAAARVSPGGPGRHNTVLRAGYGFYYDQSSLATG